MKGSLIVVGFFVLGVCLGRLDLAPALLMDSRVTFAALCCLLFCVGMSIGSNDNIVSEFRSLNPRLALLPVATILGSFAGSLVAWLFLQYRGVTDCMAVGSGFAYYSISSIFITQYRGAELGTVALLANIYREILTLLIAPLLAKVFGPLAPISSGGATTMDTTLPIISQTCGQQYVVVSLFHGFVVDFSVPFLVTMWCML
ncbi:MAG: lysine exporter LysO family protein [Prevotella sp.]|uniref:lysine exporter LysO family protein n=1 Tax=Prevotella sp. TaxID=59823 RepID=UPI0025DD3055|nr:lysine exporter LysO family protein [Prevotella sp.]MBD9300586.1 lysine exporter LysO family protein [Prevotella sp.]MED9898661.1 lysine exporter LysO family protein [Prevotella sp.]HRM56457.1 lysine exporter LysO family protein [Prevotella sp.]